MKQKHFSGKLLLVASLGCSVLALSGCGGQTPVSSPNDVASFKGNSDSPEAKAAAQRAMAEDAQKSAAARAAAQKSAPAKQ